MSVKRVEMELRNLPRFRIMEYLIQAGGSASTEVSVAGPGWRAQLEAMAPAYVGKLQVQRDMLIIEGDDAVVMGIYAFMRQKTMRGGG
jgi:hypothetical protein